MIALADNPDQRAWLMEGFDGRIGQATEEFVRWASPVTQFARFATADTEIAGQQIRAGDKLGLFYCSGNRDDSVFTDPGSSIWRAHPTHTSGSVEAARISVSGTSSPRSNCETCSANY